MGTNSDAIYEDHDDNNREKPAHKVCLDSFYLDTYEVTQKKWDEVMSFNRSVFHHPDRPITNINWREARTFCKKTVRAEIEPRKQRTIRLALKPHITHSTSRPFRQGS